VKSVFTNHCSAAAIPASTNRKTWKTKSKNAQN